MTILVAKIGAALVALTAIVSALFAMQVQELSLGSVSVTSEYTSTSTALDAVYGAQTSTEFLIKSGRGTFGSFVITGADTGVVNFYDATTTDVTARAASKATSTLLLASFPESTVAGTYVLDVIFKDGLLMFVEQGNMPTTTITWRR